MVRRKKMHPFFQVFMVIAALIGAFKGVQHLYTHFWGNSFTPGTTYLPPSDPSDTTNPLYELVAREQVEELKRRYDGIGRTPFQPSAAGGPEPPDETSQTPAKDS